MTNRFLEQKIRIVKAFLADLWYKTIYVFSAGFFSSCFGMRMERRNSIPPTGPVLVVANHQSFLDPPLVGLCVGRPLVYLARKSLFRKKAFSALIRSLNAVPIDQDGVGKEGLKTILDELKKNKAVLVFPEGSRTPDGAMHEFKPGVHLLIKRSHAPIVPVGIAGAYEALPIWRKYVIPSPLFPATDRGPIAVVVGPTLSSEHLASLPREEAMRILFDEIAKVQLRAEEIRGNAEFRMKNAECRK